MPTYDFTYAKHQDGIANRIARAWELKQVIKRLDPKPGERILDIGCNTGELVNLLRTKHGADAIGIDVNQDVLHSSQNPYLALMSAEQLGFQDKSIDKIVCAHSIEHFEKPQQAAAEMLRVTKDKGTIVVAYPVELFRGMTSVASAVRQYRNPFKAGEFHRSAFTPYQLEVYFNGHRSDSTMVFTPQPVFFTVTTKGQESTGAEQDFIHLMTTGDTPDILQPVKLLHWVNGKYRAGDFWWEDNLGYLNAKIEEINTPPTSLRKTTLGVAKILGVIALMGLGLKVKGNHNERVDLVNLIENPVLTDVPPPKEQPPSSPESSH